MYPEKELGKTFWDKIYEKVYEQYGTTEIPVNTFNKVWITPDKAVVYENEDTAFVMESRLKVMLEEDYLAMEHNQINRRGLIHQTLDENNINAQKGVMNHAPTSHNFQTPIIRDVIIPAIEKEVNEGEHFAQLRQIYHSLILAIWFKMNLKESLLGQIYVDQSKVAGVDVQDRDIKNKIYHQYLEAFSKGVYDYIKEDVDAGTQEVIPRKYFSGGFSISPQFKTDIEIIRNVSSPIESDGEFVRVFNVFRKNSVIKGKDSVSTEKSSSPVNTDLILQFNSAKRLQGIVDQKGNDVVKIVYDEVNLSASIGLLNLKENIVVPFKDGGGVSVIQNMDARVTVAVLDNNSDLSIMRFDDNFKLLEEAPKINLVPVVFLNDTRLIPILKSLWQVGDEVTRRYIEEAIKEIDAGAFDKIRSNSKDRWTTGTTFKERLNDLDSLILNEYAPLNKDPYVIADMSASDGSTSLNLIQRLAGQPVRVEASDYLVYLRVVRKGNDVAVFDTRGNIWQMFIKGEMFAAGFFPEGYEELFQQVYERGEYFEFSRIYPEAEKYLMEYPDRLTIREADVFDPNLPKDKYHIVRSLNLIQSFSSVERKKEMVRNLGHTVREDGYLMVGKSNFKSDFTLWQRKGSKLIHIKDQYAQADIGFGDVDLEESSSPIGNKGGIDFNPNNLNLQIQGKGFDYNASIDSQMLEELISSPLDGLTPVIFQIIPVTNLPLLLGTVDQQEEPFDTPQDERPNSMSFLYEFRNSYFLPKSLFTA